MKAGINKAGVRFLVVDDEATQREILHDILSDEGYGVDLAESGEAAIRKLGGERYTGVITDLKMPGADGIEVLKAALEADENTVVVLMTAYGTVDTAVQAMKLGATDYLNKPLRKDELLIVLEKALQNHRLAQENLELHRELESRYYFDKIIGASDQMNEVYRLIGKVLNNNSTVLITGESGTGKELVARAIHFNGSRRKGPFVPVNCAAIPKNLIESELFGHEKGAFSGATARRLGKFESANGGTLFLDEISTLQYDLQAKFLRVIQEMEFQRVGGDELIGVDVRIITATNRSLRRLTAEGAFRDDLFHRLNVVNVELPPLRSRKSDIPLLVKSFLEKYGRKYEKPGVSMNVETVEALGDYDWPGNVRELENLVEQLVVLGDTPRIGPQDLPSYIFEDTADESVPGAAAAEGEREGLPGPGAVEGRPGFKLPQGGVRLSDMEKSLILEALERSGGRLVGACKLLGISYKTLQYRIKKYGIDVAGIKA
ncbi:MAG: sigma-54-dependent Fis family transcriptional regulator [Candidatus Glassbacteria bacterium]|nr:sigma-54-dependent Fis family transcriptional regulator [Candidatus Glassbacteria bacterium]